MNKGDKVWSWKDGKTYKVKAFRMVKIGDRDVMKVRVFGSQEFFYDELMVLKRKADTFIGRLIGL